MSGEPTLRGVRYFSNSVWLEDVCWPFWGPGILTKDVTDAMLCTVAVSARQY